MSVFTGVTINTAQYPLTHGTGTIAVFIYSGTSNPKSILDLAISKYVGHKGYHELIDANLDNPWMRVILSDINNMSQEPFDPNKHKL